VTEGRRRFLKCGGRSGTEKLRGLLPEDVKKPGRVPQDHGDPSIGNARDEKSNDLTVFHPGERIECLQRIR
jgi:hypothetical protein